MKCKLQAAAILRNGFFNGIMLGKCKNLIHIWINDLSSRVFILVLSARNALPSDTYMTHHSAPAGLCQLTYWNSITNTLSLLTFCFSSQHSHKTHRILICILLVISHPHTSKFPKIVSVHVESPSKAMPCILQLL